MTTWDSEIFSTEANVEFLDELTELDRDGIVDAVRDAVLLASGESATEDELDNGRAAATIAAIWAGAPFSAGEIADSYEFIRGGVADVDEQLSSAAAAVLEGVDTEEDVDQFIEALS
ncbi:MULTISPECIES: hypothetical protein [unclassified Corynebacterium]|uniref:hypothetical protein n=1 Tax=unclassified Corynebacterium TaxID=2624378 RepID=UPI002A915AB5|nr:hypothetical protein [Corynebacterium sp.]MDY5786317.1 hypothetical protein [Corynebacterium sp.]